MTRRKHRVDVLTCNGRLAKHLEKIRGDLGKQVHVTDVAHRRWDNRATTPNRTVMVSFVADIDEAAISLIHKLAPRIGRYLLMSQTECVEALAERVTRLNVRAANRLHIASVRSEDCLEGMLRRLVSSLTHDREYDSILDAWWEGDDFVVMSHRFERLRITPAQLRSLRFFAKASNKRLGRFEIDDDGSAIRWPDLDVDLDWNGFLRLSGRHDRLRLESNAQMARDYGDAIRRLRAHHELRQSDVAGLDERHVRRIEKGESPVTHSALAKLAQSHGMSLGDYLDAVAAGLLSNVVDGNGEIMRRRPWCRP